MYGSGLAGLRTVFVGAPTSGENKPFAAIGGALYQRMKQMGNQRKATCAKLGITPASLRFADRCQKLISDPTLASAEVMSSNETWKLRQDFMRDSRPARPSAQDR
jgi:hypothetical protein